ncbi:MAG TPA: hypothetical protein VHW44_15730 [Pseudonocardiaceae bacterium]|jgi:hypothetical protein|nr:hypothetical protein [Pseudonocardiaceae bacterium]
MRGWDRQGDELIVGLFSHQEITFFRERISALRTMAALRLASCPTLRPFGAAVDIEISAALPVDERLLRLLEKFLRSQPSETWVWHELDFWREMVASCDTCLATLPDLDGRLELPRRHGRMFQGLLSAIVVITLPRDRADPNRFSWTAPYEWLRRTGLELHAVISAQSRPNAES